MPISSPNGLITEVNQIIQASLDAVNPYSIVRNLISRNSSHFSIGRKNFELDRIRRIFVVGVGKAVLPMAKGLLEVIGEDISSGILVPKHIGMDLSPRFLQKIKIFKGDHPVPTERSAIAGREIHNFLSSTRENDLVIGLISGGGSSLVTLPMEPVSIGDINKLTQTLLQSGASIQEFNTVRKHLDKIKGGGLLRFIHPARSIHLILSDVIGDDLSVIASGPTTSDPTTYQDAIHVLNSYGIWGEIPSSIKELLLKGEKGEIPETIKPEDPLLEKVDNCIIGSLSIAANEAKRKAESLGFRTEIIDLELIGEARSNGSQLVHYLKNRLSDFSGSDSPICLIAGGETTVTVSGRGTGGRNQELALAAALELDGMNKVQILTLATDGEDGPTDAAGAIVDGQTIQRAREIGLNAQNFLLNNDAYNFFKKTGELIFTGPTGTNVNDLVFMFIYP
ncbi:MAG: glycerate kinase [Chloroflexi bacterium]|nr:glycerate kinase [Chloroflexota bacterium]